MSSIKNYSFELEMEKAFNLVTKKSQDSNNSDHVLGMNIARNTMNNIGYIESQFSDSFNDMYRIYRNILVLSNKN